MPLSREAQRVASRFEALPESHRPLVLDVLVAAEKAQREQPAPATAARARVSKRTDQRSTAIHEAGHGALLIALGLGLKKLTILADHDSAGACFDGGEWGRLARRLGDKDDQTATLRMGAEEAFFLRRAITRYAGAEAIRQLMPEDPDPDAGADNDKRWAVFAISEITDDAQSIDLFSALAKRRCALLVEHYRPEIAAIARVLEVKKMLSGNAARKIFFSSLRKRKGSLMRF
jgi:hypothetical protein